MSAETIVRVPTTGIDIAYERLGRASDPPVLLVMGVAAQLVAWPDGWCAALLDRGLQVVRFDNRDAGRSTHCSDAPPPDLQAALGGDLASASYTLSDMAADTAGLIEALGLGAAHVVGLSMGGAIAQLLALEHRPRVRSLTTMMSSTGAPAVGQADPAAVRDMFAGGPATTRAGFIEQRVRAQRVVGSPGFASDEAAVRERASRAFDRLDGRSNDAQAAARQAVATVASGDRTARLRGLDVPTLVVHGAADRLCHVSGGRAVAAAIPGAELWEVEGLGHDLPPALWPALAARIAALVARADAAPRKC
jgi:pimeloyl-ACP methyl ester carboxylesterase